MSDHRMAAWGSWGMVALLVGCTSPSPAPPREAPPGPATRPVVSAPPAAPVRPASPPAPVAQSPEVDPAAVAAGFLPTVAAGEARARAEKKTLLLVFGRSGCGRCREWVRRVLLAPSTLSELEQVVTVKRDADLTDRAEYQILVTPVMVFKVWDESAGDLVFADILRGPEEAPVFQARARAAARGSNRCQEMLSRIRADREDDEAWYELQNNYLMFLTPDQRRELAGLR